MTVVNLNKFKKTKAKSDKNKKSDENRIKHGRTKSQKKLEQSSKSMQDKILDIHKIDNGKNNNS